METSDKHPALTKILAESSDREALISKFWAQLDPSIEGYAKAIDKLLGLLPDEVLSEMLSGSDI